MSDMKIYAVLGAAAALAAATVIQVRAANDKFTFPDGFDKGVEYLTVDKPNKQVHIFYASKEAIAAAKAGMPMPEGTSIRRRALQRQARRRRQSGEGHERPLHQGHAAPVRGDAEGAPWPTRDKVPAGVASTAIWRRRVGKGASASLTHASRRAAACFAHCAGAIPRDGSRAVCIAALARQFATTPFTRRSPADRRAPRARPRA